MIWTTEAPRADHVGHFFWMKRGDEQPKVVLITRWAGNRAMYVGIAECLDPNIKTVYMREIAVGWPHRTTIGVANDSGTHYSIRPWCHAFHGRTERS